VSVWPFCPVKLWKVKLPIWVLVPFQVPVGVVRFVKSKFPMRVTLPEHAP